MTYVLGLDNNMDSVMRARLLTERLKPKLRHRLRHPFQRYYFRAFYDVLPGLQSTFGFNRDLQASLDSVKRYYGTLRDRVQEAKAHDLKCGAHTVVHFRPTSLSGAHAGAPQWLLNLETRVQGLTGFNIGLAAIPNDITSATVFKQVFPLMLASKHYGFDCWVLWDNALATGYRPIHKQDELVARGIIATMVGYTHDAAFPGPGDIWRTLAGEGNGFVGVAAFEEVVGFRRKFPTFWRRVTDRGVITETIRRGLTRVIGDPRAKLVDASDGATAQIVTVAGNLHLEDFQRALDDTLLPSNTTIVAAPYKDRAISFARFWPITGNVRSLDRIWALPRKRRHAELLPSEVLDREIARVWPIVERTAQFAGVTPESLLEGS
jgi:hypothetical protein